MANLTTKRDTSFQNKKLKVVLIKEIPIAHDIYSLTEPPEKLFTRITDQPNRSISTSLAYLSSLLQNENITSNKNDQ